MKPKATRRTKADVLTNALYMALIAPTDEQAQRASSYADLLAQGMESGDVEACKADALKRAEAETVTKQTAMETYIAKVLAQAPPLTDEQRTKLVDLMRRTPLTEEAK